MSKFKIGDRVRITDAEATPEFIGFTGVVSRVEEEYVDITPDCNRPDGHGLADFLWDIGSVELVIPEDQWQWTNDDHTEARKGRWTVYLFGGTNKTWWLGHADFGDALIRAEKSDAPTDNAAERFDQVLNDFLAWLAEQNQPDEPTGFGYVGHIQDGVQRWDVSKRSHDLYDLTYSMNGAVRHSLVWDEVLKVGKFEALE